MLAYALSSSTWAPCPSASDAKAGPTVSHSRSVILLSTNAAARASVAVGAAEAGAGGAGRGGRFTRGIAIPYSWVVLRRKGAQRLSSENVHLCDKRVA